MKLSLLTSTLTHPESAWWVQIVPQALTIAAVLSLTLLLRRRLYGMSHSLLVHRAARYRMGTIDPALSFTPPIASAQQMLLISCSALIATFFICSRAGYFFVALLLSGPSTALLIWFALWILEHRYVEQLDRELPGAVNRLSAMISSGTGPQQALEQVMQDMDPGPLRTEWAFIIERLGAPLLGGTRATAAEVVAALAIQTPSARHRGLLGHLEMALSQTQDVLRARLAAAATALYAAEQRRSAAITELAQVRYGGLAVGLAGITMALYLFLTQRERFALAYQGVLGAVVGAVMILVLLAPILAGWLLSQADELDY